MWRSKQTAPTAFHKMVRAGLPALCLATGFTAAGQAASPPVSNRTPPVEFITVAANAETVTLITGLMGIERDLMLGQLFLKDGLVNPEGSHFLDARGDNFTPIQAGLASAGAPDLDPLLTALETAQEPADVNKAYLDLLSGVQLAKQALKPTDADVLSSVIQTADNAASMLDASGTTEVHAYQECWGLLMVARGQLDSLMKSSDTTIRQSAEKWLSRLTM